LNDRRERCLREFARAKAEEDWPAALDILHGELHELEGYAVRTTAHVEDVRLEVSKISLLLADVYERLGLLTEKRAIMSSASNLDAQALAQAVESLERHVNATAMAAAAEMGRMRTRIDGLDAELGMAPDPTRDIKGHGMRGVVAKLDTRRTAVLLTLAGVAGGGGLRAVEHLVKWLTQGG